MHCPMGLGSCARPAVDSVWLYCGSSTAVAAGAGCRRCRYYRRCRRPARPGRRSRHRGRRSHDVAQHRASFDRSQLLLVADEDQAGLRPDRIEQASHKGERHHRGLIHDDHVVGQLVVVVVTEAGCGAGRRPSNRCTVEALSVSSQVRTFSSTSMRRASLWTASAIRAAALPVGATRATRGRGLPGVGGLFAEQGQHPGHRRRLARARPPGDHAERPRKTAMAAARLWRPDRPRGRAGPDPRPTAPRPAPTVAPHRAATGRRPRPFVPPVAVEVQPAARRAAAAGRRAVSPVATSGLRASCSSHGCERGPRQAGKVEPPLRGRPQRFALWWPGRPARGRPGGRGRRGRSPAPPARRRRARGGPARRPHECQPPPAHQPG